MALYKSSILFIDKMEQYEPRLALMFVFRLVDLEVILLLGNLEEY